MRTISLCLTTIIFILTIGCNNPIAINTVNMKILNHDKSTVRIYIEDIFKDSIPNGDTLSITIPNMQEIIAKYPTYDIVILAFDGLIKIGETD